MTKAEPGDNIGFNIRGVAKNEIGRGEVMGSHGQPADDREEFIDKSSSSTPNCHRPGYTPVLHAHTATVGVTFEELIKKIDPRTGQWSRKSPASSKSGTARL